MVRNGDLHNIAIIREGTDCSRIFWNKILSSFKLPVNKVVSPITDSRVTLPLPNKQIIRTLNLSSRSRVFETEARSLQPSHVSLGRNNERTRRCRQAFSTDVNMELVS